MINTANLGQALLETVQSLPPPQQEAVLHYAQSLSLPNRDRTAQIQTLLLDLEKIQIHHGEPTIAVYIDSLLSTIREMRDRTPYDHYTEVAIALHDAMAIRNSWVNYSVEQYRGAYTILTSLAHQTEISNESAEEAILTLDSLGFAILPLRMLPNLGQLDDSANEDE
jgi:hypothetical protein